VQWEGLSSLYFTGALKIVKLIWCAMKGNVPAIIFRRKNELKDGNVNRHRIECSLDKLATILSTAHMVLRVVLSYG
jgi:hypothetical protein